MKMTMSCKNVRNTGRFEKFVKEKTQKICKFFDGEASISWIFTRGDGGILVDIKVSSPAFYYHAHTLTASPYEGVDIVLGKIERQVIKKKEKIKNKIHRRAEVLDLDAEREEKEIWEREVEMYYDYLDKAA